MTALMIIGVGVMAAVLTTWYSSRHHGPMPVIDSDDDEPRVVDALDQFPSLTPLGKRRLSTASAGRLLLTVSVAAVFLLNLFSGWVLDSLDENTGFASFDESVVRSGAEHATTVSASLIKGLTDNVLTDNVLTDLGGTFVITVVTIIAAAYGWWR